MVHLILITFQRGLESNHDGMHGADRGGSQLSRLHT